MCGILSWATAVTLLAAGALTSCGSDEKTSPGGGSSDAVVIDITIADGEVSPNGDAVDASVGQPIELRVDSDVADELHVHSEPEQEFEVEANPGTDQVFTFSVDLPGQVEVELHELEATIVELVVQP